MPFYEIKNQTDTSSDLYIYGDIVTEKYDDDENSTDLKQFKELVEALVGGQTLNIYLNSGGGSVFAASAMVSMLKRAQTRGVKVVSYIDGLAASAASLFPMVSDESHIYPNSMIMIHKPIVALWLAVMNANDLTKLANELESIENGTLIPLYKARTKLSDQKLKNAIANETWYTADEIMDNFDGFTLHDEAKAAAACTSEYFARYRHTPDALKDQTPPAAPEPEEQEEAPTNTEKPDMTSVYQNYFILKKKGRLHQHD